MKTDLSKYDNSWYNPGSRLKRFLWYYTNLIFFEGGWNLSSGLKVLLLKCFGAKVGKGVVIKPKVSVKYPWKLKIGDHCWIGEKAWIDNLEEVVLEDNVCISQGAMLLCGNHNYTKPHFDLMVAPIKLKAGSWVGAKSIVAPGVTLYNHSVLSLSSVATSDLEPFGVYSGNPAKKVKMRRIDVS